MGEIHKEAQKKTIGRDRDREQRAESRDRYRSKSYPAQARCAVLDVIFDAITCSRDTSSSSSTTAGPSAYSRRRRRSDKSSLVSTMWKNAETQTAVHWLQ